MGSAEAGRASVPISDAFPVQPGPLAVGWPCAMRATSFRSAAVRTNASMTSMAARDTSTEIRGKRPITRTRSASRSMPSCVQICRYTQSLTCTLINKEQWKRASSEWNKGLHYDGTKGAPRRSAQSRKEKGLSKAQRLAKVWSSAKTTESFLRTPDMREQKADPELKASEQAARSRQSKRCHSAPPRRLMFFTKTRSKPLDSKGGCFSAPLGVDNWGPASSGINTGTTINQWNQTKASVSAGYNVAPSEKSLVPHLSTVYPYCGEAPRGPASRSELNGKKQKPTAMRYTQQQPIPSRFCYY